uniref:Uncharacterized protein n=1 Tax=Rangifer tarandus platyrhynchus TaxID=3082113 RepID=A0ACB0E3E9_RANTA|nr:unnamed protein product [Rangifer tarandus platyrhynchus]
MWGLLGISVLLTRTFCRKTAHANGYFWCLARKAGIRLQTNSRLASYPEDPRFPGGHAADGGGWDQEPLAFSARASTPCVFSPKRGVLHTLCPTSRPGSGPWKLWHPDF